MKVIVVDDEPAARRTLRECCAAEPDIEVIGEFGDGRAALEVIRDQPPDLLFLDIQMDSLDGIALARALDPETLPLIVFVTAYDHYALDAFEVSAIDYLVKPFDEERFRKALERVRRRHEDQHVTERQAALTAVLAQLDQHIRAKRPEVRSRILAESGGRMHVLDADRIELVESDRNYVTLRVGCDCYHARSTLQNAELSLQSQPMLRISRSCLVNVNYLREVNRTPRGDFILVVQGGTTETSSEGFRMKVRESLRALKLCPD